MSSALLIVICLIVSSGKQEMMTATELPGWTAYLNKHAFVEAAELCQLSFEEANTTRVDPICYMVRRNDQPHFIIVNNLEQIGIISNITSRDEHVP